ncbi:MAG: hemin uptake protein HemP [Pirellulaceae bacterium]
MKQDSNSTGCSTNGPPQPQLPDQHAGPAGHSPPPGADISSQTPSESCDPIRRVVAERLPKIVPFDDLARCGDEIWIENNGQIYRLRKTRQGKLILTK